MGKEEELKAAAIAAGKDWEIEKLKHVKADVAAALEKRKAMKTDPDQGFSSFEQATFRKYNGLLKQIKPDMEKYHEEKDKVRCVLYNLKRILAIYPNSCLAILFIYRYILFYRLAMLS